MINKIYHTRLHWLKIPRKCWWEFVPNLREIWLCNGNYFPNIIHIFFFPQSTLSKKRMLLISPPFYLLFSIFHELYKIHMHKHFLSFFMLFVNQEFKNHYINNNWKESSMAEKLRKCYEGNNKATWKHILKTLLDSRSCV